MDKTEFVEYKLFETPQQKISLVKNILRSPAPKDYLLSFLMSHIATNERIFVENRTSLFEFIKGKLMEYYGHKPLNEEMVKKSLDIIHRNINYEIIDVTERFEPYNLTDTAFKTIDCYKERMRMANVLEKSLIRSITDFER